MNAIPGASLLGFTSSTGFPVNNIEFEGYSQCTTLAAGTVTFTYGGNGSSVPLTTLNPVTLFGGGKYTIMATGSPSTPSSLFLPDTFTAPPSGSAALRVVNTIPIGNVDIYVGPPNSVLLTPSATNVAVGSAAYIMVPAAHGLQVWLTTPQTTNVLAATNPTVPITFPAGDEETLFFIGSVGGSTALSFTVPNCP